MNPGSMNEAHRAFQCQVSIPAGSEKLDGDLCIPANSTGLVVFAHGSGSGRHSPRNQFVGRALEQARIATLLLDLLTTREAIEDERTLRFRFDIPLLADRLVASVDWAETDPRVQRLSLGLYGASTGGAAALIAAAARPFRVKALVLRGARSDLADEYAGRVTAPTLCIVGGLDPQILSFNRETARQLKGPSRVTIVPQATHLFEEPGALESVTVATVAWFQHHLLTEKSQAGAEAE
jgi:dienelactone hydrolase